MADSFLSNLINGPAKPVDANDPTYTSPEAIKNRFTLADALSGRATQPFAPNVFGVLAAGVTGANSGMTRGSAEGASAANQSITSDAYKRAAVAPDANAMTRTLMDSGVPHLADKGLDLMIKKKGGLDGNKFGKQGAIFEDKDGSYYSIQFADDGTKKVERVSTPGPDGVQVPLSPAKGVKTVDTGTGTDIVSANNGVTVRNIPKQLEAKNFDEKAGDNAAKAVETYSAAAKDSLSKLQRLQQLENLASNPDVYQGKAANLVLEAKKAGMALGMDFTGVPESEAMRAIGNQFALGLRSTASGEGMPGAMSDADRDFLLQSIPNLSNTPQGNALLIRMSRESEEYKARASATAIRYIRAKKSTDGLEDYMGQWMSANPMFTKRTSGAVTALTGIQHGVKTGPVEGERVEKPNTGRLSDSPEGKPMIPPAAVRDLTSNPTPKAIKQFEDVFGAGSASQFLTQR
jgi:hypothetical protein